jgi:hypothetical protein
LPKPVFALGRGVYYLARRIVCKRGTGNASHPGFFAPYFRADLLGRSRV